MPRYIWVALSVLAVVGTAHAQEPKASTLERIKRDGVLRWGADPSGGAPFVFVDPKDPNRVIGWEVDLVNMLARKMGVTPELVKGDWATLVQSMLAHRVDVVVNGLEINPERARVVRFTNPYYIYQQQITVAAKDRNKFKSLYDLRGHKIAVLGGSASVNVLRGFGWPDELILTYDDSLAPYTEIELGRASAALAESIIADYYAGPKKNLHNLPNLFAPGQYGAAVRPEDVDLAVELNRLLDEMKKNGELGQLYQRWNIWTPDQVQLGTHHGPDVSPDNQGDPAGRDWPLILTSLGMASVYTLLLTAISMPLAVLLGLILALMARSRHVLLHGTAWLYIQVVRGTPLLVQLYLIYYTLPDLGHYLGLGNLLTWNKFVVGILCLSLNYAAYEAEIHRAGLDAIPKGQREAAVSLGMSENQAFIYVILPQSFRIILPPVLNDLISMLKDSCLVGVIGVQELLQVALGIGKSNFAVPELLVAAAVFYLILSWIADFFGKRLEARLKRRGVHVPESSL